MRSGRLRHMSARVRDRCSPPHAPPRMGPHGVRMGVGGWSRSWSGGAAKEETQVWRLRLLHINMWACIRRLLCGAYDYMYLVVLYINMWVQYHRICVPAYEYCYAPPPTMRPYDLPYCEALRPTPTRLLLYINMCACIRILLCKCAALCQLTCYYICVSCYYICVCSNRSTCVSYSDIRAYFTYVSLTVGLTHISSCDFFLSLFFY